MDCPKCHAPNPDTSRFCGSCAAPLQEGAPTDVSPLTKTLKTTPPFLAEGTMVAGKYRVLKQIGRGGMGVVYEAEDLKLRRSVALKFLPGELTDDDEARERFTHEAQAASVLDNPHICTIHEIGETESRQMYIAMALSSGESLRAKVKRGPLNPAEALSIAAQVADGLAAAHENGIVHRDIKPGNILVSKEGTARIADFGLAKLAGEARVTRPGSTVGTVAYMSPEQLRGEDVDGRTDIWSLGVVLYEMLTGRLPFQGHNEHSLAYAIVHSDADFIRSLLPVVPAGCGPVIEKAMAKDPARRFASAREMADALAAVRESAGLLSSRWTKQREARPRRPALIRIGIPAVLAAAAVFAVVAVGVPKKIAGLLGLAGRAGGRHITVLPLTLLNEGAGDRVFADGLAELLRRRLEFFTPRLPDSWVNPEFHLRRYDVREAADALRVLGSNAVVSGTLKRTGDSLAVTLEVFDPDKYRRLASLPKTDHIANIATWQEDLVIDVATAISLNPAPGDKSLLAALGTTVPGAFASFVRGLGILAGPETAENADDAVQALEEAVRLDPSFAEAAIELAGAYWRKCAAAKDESFGRKAESQARAVLKTNDKLVRGHLMLGTVLQGLGRSDEAVREFETALALDARSFDAQIRLASRYSDLSQPVKAEAAYRAALRLRPSYWVAHSSLGLFYFYQGAFEKARDEFLTVTRLCPGNINGLNNLGAAYFKLGDNGLAEATFERSNAIRRNSDACSNLAVLYYYRGRYADSVMMNEAAIGFGMADYSHWGNLADAYHFTPGNESKAAEAYEKAIGLAEAELATDKGDPHVRSSLAFFLAMSGLTDRAQAEIAEALRIRPDDNTLILRSILVYEVCGARRRALDALRDYVRVEGPLEEVVKDPFLAGLRKDQAYLEIVGKTAGGKPEKAKT